MRVFKYSTQDNLWVQRGVDMDGEAEGDEFGHAVAISGDGTVVANNGFDTDTLKIMKWSTCSSPPPSSMPSSTPDVSVCCTAIYALRHSVSNLSTRQQLTNLIYFISVRFVLSFRSLVQRWRNTTPSRYNHRPLSQGDDMGRNEY